jgi:hypothetical protein
MHAYKKGCAYDSLTYVIREAELWSTTSTTTMLSRRGLRFHTTQKKLHHHGSHEPIAKVWP